MIDSTISTNQVATAVAWTVVAVLYVVAGGFMLSGYWQAAIFIAEVACGVSAYAAVRHLRCYAARICDLIRRSDRRAGDLDGPPPVPLQRIH